MKNPWEEINLNDYESHMSLDSVFQLQAMNEIMKVQLYTYAVKSVMILGIAGGNGLEHIDQQSFGKVYAIDINKNYLKECEKRYPELKNKLETICTDLEMDELQLPQADLLVANLLIEYIGYACFQKTVKKVRPQYISCIIQINMDHTFVSDSPYLHAFEHLNSVHHHIDKNTLINAMNEIGYKIELLKEKELPNGKKLTRIDFAANSGSLIKQ